MTALLDPESPLVGLGMTSLVLAFIALLVFFMPILGIPISLCALCFGVVGFIVALFAPRASLRWSLGGIAASCLALGVNLAIAYAPSSYLPDRKVPTPWQAVPDRPYVPPRRRLPWVLAISEGKNGRLSRRPF
jgi:hypothetical protein